MDELTEEQLLDCQRALARLGDELREVLESSRDGARPVDLDQPIGRLSRMDAMQQQQMVVANRAAQTLRLDQVGHALRAFAAGTYGECRRCDDPIGFARLQARPEAPFCLDCQDAIESRR